MYNPPVHKELHTSELDLTRPVASAASIVRSIFLSPRRFFLNFSAEGPLREPIIFVLLVSAMGAAIGVAVALVLGAIFGGVDARDVGVTLLEAAVYVIVAPLIVGVLSGAYLLSLRTFVGPDAGFREVYRMLAYAYGAMILFWIPVVGAFAFTYAMLVLMAVAFRYVYRASFVTALVTALVGYVPAALLFIFLTVRVTGLVFT